MNDTKPAVASTSVWGSLLALAGVLAPVILTAIGVRTPDDQAAAVTTATQLATGIGAAVALYGRLTATKKISGVTQPAATAA